MSNEFKDISIKNTHYFCDDVINIKNVNSDNIKVDEKSYKNIPNSYIGCAMIIITKE